jgi:hypothetical protein
MIMTKLEKARRAVADVESAIADIRAEQQSAAAVVARAQAALATVNAKAAAKQAMRAERERGLSVAEDAALDQHCIELASETIVLQSQNPLKNRNRVIANVHLLRRSVRTAMDWPINKPYFVEPIILQALALLPPRDPLDTPVNELGYRGAPWETRRRQLLAEFETEPLEAA